MQKVPNKRAFDYDVRSLLAYPPEEQIEYYIVTNSGMPGINGNYYFETYHNACKAYRKDEDHIIMSSDSGTGDWFLWENYYANSSQYYFHGFSNDSACSAPGGRPVTDSYWEASSSIYPYTQSILVTLGTY
jgi:hypothetical protein